MTIPIGNWKDHSFIHYWNASRFNLEMWINIDAEGFVQAS